MASESVVGVAPLNQAEEFMEPAPVVAVTPAPRVSTQLEKFEVRRLALLDAWSPGSPLSSQATACARMVSVERRKNKCKRVFFIVQFG